MNSADIQDDIDDCEALTDALRRLILAADANGVELEGGYDCAGEEDGIEYGIEIYRVVGRPG